LHLSRSGFAAGRSKRGANTIRACPPRSGGEKSISNLELVPAILKAMRLHVLQHADHEGPGTIARWASDREHTLVVTRTDRASAFPSLESFDALLVLGGPMSVNDERGCPWLVAEKDLIRRAIAADKRLLGICLGGQLVAEALGGKVINAPQKEIGWFPIELTEEGKTHPFFAGLPSRCEVVHWHGETFSLPSGSVRLARSPACANQAFAWKSRVLALQFHPELAPEQLELWIESGSDELVPGAFVQSGEGFRRAARLVELERHARRLLDNFLGI
jgi:GMP synthase-like glutamine amidotransferase